MVLHEHEEGLILWGEMKDLAVCQTLPNPRHLTPDGLWDESGVSQMVSWGHAVSSFLVVFPEVQTILGTSRAIFSANTAGCMSALYPFLPFPFYRSI